MKKFIIGFLIFALVIYFFTSNFLYSLEYSNSELEQQINEKEKSINDLMIKKNTNSSKEEAKEETDLTFNDNVYYLKKIEEQE